MLLDTHAIIWYLFEPSRLTERSLTVIRKAVRRGSHVSISAVSVLELIYLIEKGKVEEIVLSRLQGELSKPRPTVVCIPFDSQIAIEARRIPREQVPDMPDRIIAATALHLGVPLITRDRRIQAADVETIW